MFGWVACVWVGRCLCVFGWVVYLCVCMSGWVDVCAFVWVGSVFVCVFWWVGVCVSFILGSLLQWKPNKILP